MILGLIDEAVEGGARQAKACEIVGVDPRTVQRWRSSGVGEDGRAGPRREPWNKLTVEERNRLLAVLNAPDHRDLSPKQIVPRLADAGVYLASESTMYRLLQAESQLAHRGPARAPEKRYRPEEWRATGPNQVWSWDITYLRSSVRGQFFYLYLAVDVWSRKIVGWSVHEVESTELAAQLIEQACADEGTRPGLVLHSDNGAPMKGATMLAKLRDLGVVTSFSRPGVSNDNPYSESLFRTVKYRPEFPRGCFASLDDARAWVERFVRWYNTEHRHSGIKYVTPEQRHLGQDIEILCERSKVYEAARQRHPERWAGSTRDWSPVGEVCLNPQPALVEDSAA